MYLNHNFIPGPAINKDLQEQCDREDNEGGDLREFRVRGQIVQTRTQH